MSQIFRSWSMHCAVGALCLATAMPSVAAKPSKCEEEKPMTLALLKVSGMFGAMEKACKLKSDAEVAKRKQLSIESLKKETCITAAEFSKTYDAGYQEAEAHMGKVSASEREKECKAFTKK